MGEQVICPTCGTPGEAGCFCEMGCGRLPRAAAGEPRTAAASPQVQARSVLTRPRLVAMFPKQFRQSCAGVVTFVYGFPEDVFERLELVVCDGMSELGRTQTDYPPGRSGELRVSVEPVRAGDLMLDVQLVCHLPEGGGTLVYRTEFPIQVKPSPQAISFSPTINITGNYGNDLAGAKIGTLNMPESSLVDSQTLVDRNLELKVARTPCRLLLTKGDEVLQILAVAQVRMGRRRENDIVVRVFGTDGTTRDDQSRRVSGTHLRISVSQDGVRVTDGGDRPSTNGTFVDGRQLPPGGSQIIHAGACEVGFGQGVEGLRIQVGIRRDGYGRVTGCMLARTDGARRRTILLPRGGMDPGQSGDYLSWNEKFFTFKAASGQRTILEPGAEVEFEHGTWRVEMFRPTWIKSQVGNVG